jgi:PIN domain nuclease of toxin-antitoxin system
LNFLLDTHSLIWFALDDLRLSATARALIEDPNNKIMVSVVTFWEVAIKVSIGKLPLNRSYEDFVDECLKPHMFQLMPIEPAHTTRLAALPFPTGHKDPFDRLLIAQSLVEGIPIISVDAAFDAYPVQRIW